MTLTEFSYHFRNFIRLSFLAVVLYLVGKSGVIYAISYYKSKNPPPKPPPEARFDKVPRLNIKSIELGKGASPNYEIDTKTGKLPQFPDRLEVYPTTAPKGTILSEKRAKDVAESLGFNDPPTELSSTEFIWEKKESGQKLSANIILNNYKMTYDLSAPFEEIFNPKAPNDKDAKEAVMGILNKTGLYTQDLASSKIVYTYTTLENGAYKNVKNLEQAQFNKVTFIRLITNKEKSYDIVPAYPDSPLIFFVTAKTKGGSVIIPEFEYTFWKYDTDEGSKYPIISSQDAWEKVISGQGLITELDSSLASTSFPYGIYNIAKFKLRSAEISYVESKNFFPFLQPYYVFKGVAVNTNNIRGDFTIYYPAVSKEKFLD